MKTTYKVSCHCGRVRGKFLGDEDKLTAWRCNCSDCAKRGNIHVIIPEEDFSLDMEETMDEAAILYLWGTRTARRYFCRTCGILPWYTPRSNPDGYALTLACIDLDEKGDSRPQVDIRDFDGQNWEKSFASSNISEQSTKC